MQTISVGNQLSYVPQVGPRMIELPVWMVRNGVRI